MTVLEMTRPLDQIRVAMLRLLLQSRFLRKVYSDRALRLGLNYISLYAVYLLISLKFSIVLLFLGPLLLGYPHLIASYRFVQKTGFPLQWKSAKVFQLFLFLTSVSLVIRFAEGKYFDLPELPYGAWEILLSLVALGILKLDSWRNLPAILITIVSTLILLKWAWNYPLAFVGVALILHNWVGYGHWILAAKKAQEKAIVIGAIILFAITHWFILAGYFDQWISVSELSFFSTKSFQVSGWALAPWTTDPTVWNRMIVLYAFGLSLHYFVWLRAIPQSLELNSSPNSFRRSLILLKKDCGPVLTYLLFVGVVVAAVIVLFTGYAGRIYFGVAMLHGWLELTFLSFGLIRNVPLKF